MCCNLQIRLPRSCYSGFNVTDRFIQTCQRSGIAKPYSDEVQYSQTRDSRKTLLYCRRRVSGLNFAVSSSYDVPSVKWQFARGA